VILDVGRVETLKSSHPISLVSDFGC